LYVRGTDLLDLQSAIAEIFQKEARVKAVASDHIRTESARRQVVRELTQQ
jgi:hypothetical protein